MINITMKYSKSTKGTHVYKQEGDSPAIPSLYIRRESLPKDPPQTINVFIEPTRGNKDE